MIHFNISYSDLLVGKIPYNEVTMVKIWFIVAKKGTDWNWAIYSHYKGGDK